MKLYDYYRSTASYRVRIALALKKQSYETIAIHLVNDGGEQHRPEYRAINPQGLVPAIDFGDFVLSQSMAIIEYLEETIPSPALLPENPKDRAVVRMLSEIIACDIHPLNNLRVLNRLKTQFDAEQTEVVAWYHHWLREGFYAFENHLKKIERDRPVCFGNSFSLADICLIPQVYNAKRFEFSLDEFPLIQQIDNYCLENEAFKSPGL
jgi:maleylacetoacetate isomerase